MFKDCIIELYLIIAKYPQVGVLERRMLITSLLNLARAFGINIMYVDRAIASRKLKGVSRCPLTLFSPQLC